MPAPTVYLTDRYGRKMAEVPTDASLIATGVTAGLLAGVVLKKKKKQYTGYVKKEELDAMNVRTVQIPANFAGLEAVDVPTRMREQYFEIYDVTEQDDYVEISARHIFYQNLNNYTLWKPTEDTEYTAAAVCRNVLTNAMFEPDFDVASDCTDTLPGKELDFERKNLVECFLDPENGICKKFGLSMIRDNGFIYCLKDVGYDRGFEIQDGKNLLGVERIENLEAVFTRVAPYGKDAKGGIIWLDYEGKKYIDSQYVGSYRSPRLELYDTGIQVGKDGVTADNIQAKLLEAAQKRFSEDEVDKPEVTMTVNFISLGDTEEYAQYRGLDKVYLYDIITVRDQKRGYSYAAQVIGVEHDILTGRLNSVTIGSLRNADASRKIAVWQVPEINGANIRLLSIQAGAFEPGAIQTDDLAPYIITADKIISGEIETRHLAAEAVTTEKLEAQAVTAGKIASGAITTEKLAANSVTATAIAAGAVTADKIAAGAITATKIDTTDLEAINATLGTAAIAIAEIESADINFAHIKDLNAQSAYFGQTIFDEGVGGKLYVPRLSVGYAQMIGATIGDLVIQASNGEFYGIDVDMAGNVTATLRTVSAGEIEAGHTTDGRTLVLGTDILATDLNTENIYASHALMNEITAATISVDELWARTAFINQLMTTDISSNTYIRATIGNWTGGSTITQTINSLDSRISSLGYGTIYFQPDEPNHSELVQGDIWVQSAPAGTWSTVSTDYSSWNEIYATIGTWQTLGGIPRVFTWDGRFWQELYDANLPNTVQTEIQQLADAIALRATISDLNVLSGEISEFSAELTVQAQEIQSAVSAVNQKVASYVMPVDPRTAYVVSPGDLWIKTDETASWADVQEKNETWNAVLEKYDSWMRLIGSVTYVWNGSEWLETGDRASEIYQKTLIDQTINQVEILATASAVLNDELISVSARLTVAIDAIEQEVQRATTAEDSKIAKTTNYQTADSIVQAAQTYVNGILQDEAQIQALATGITAYVANHAYGQVSGVAIVSAGIEVSGSKYIKVKTGGQFLVDSGNFSISTSGAVTVKGTITATSGTIGGWTLASKRLSAGSGASYVAMDSGTSNVNYFIWAGAEAAASAPFRVTRGGVVTATKFMILNESGTETELNLRTAGLWKLNYHVVKSVTQAGGYASSMTLSDGTTVNFKNASSGWSEAYGKYSATLSSTSLTITRPGSTYGSEATDRYGIAGYSDYSMRGLEVQVVGTTTRFTIPNNTFVGTPRIAPIYS